MDCISESDFEKSDTAEWNMERVTAFAERVRNFIASADSESMESFDAWKIRCVESGSEILGRAAIEGIEFLTGQSGADFMKSILPDRFYEDTYAAAFYDVEMARLRKRFEGIDHGALMSLIHLAKTNGSRMIGEPSEFKNDLLMLLGRLAEEKKNEIV